jgi:hypothetical protein
MTAEQNRPGIGFWSAIVVAVVLAYGISAGPASWASSRWGDGRIVTKVYRPLTRVLELRTT